MGVPQPTLAGFQHLETFCDPEDDATLKEYNDRNVIPAHRARFPLQANMKALMFLVSAELSEDQRGRLLSTLIQRGIRVPDYTIQIVQDAYRELFRNTRTGFTDPMLRRSQQKPGMHRSRPKGARSFMILDAGIMEDEHGYWVEDEDDATVYGSIYRVRCPVDT